MFKRTFILSALTLLLTLLCGTALASSYPEHVDDSYPIYYDEATGFYYQLFEDNSAAIIGYKPFWDNPSAAMSSLTIPSTIDGYPVYSIYQNAFSELSGLRHVTIGEGVEQIDVEAFRDSSLSTITLPSTLTHIEYDAFLNCLQLSEVALPAGLTFIGSSAFSGTGLKNLRLPDSVQTVHYDAFSCCPRLRAVHLGSGLTLLEDNPFWGNPALRVFTVSSENPRFSVVDGILFDDVEKKLVACPPALKLEHYTVPSGTLIVGMDAFSGCTDLVSLFLSDTVTELRDFALMDCVNMSQLHLGNGLQTIGVWSINNNQLPSLTLPSTLRTIDDECLVQLEDYPIRDGQTILYAHVDSYARQWMLDMGIEFLDDAQMTASLSARSAGEDLRLTWTPSQDPKTTCYLLTVWHPATNTRLLNDAEFTGFSAAIPGSASLCGDFVIQLNASDDFGRNCGNLNATLRADHRFGADGYCLFCRMDKTGTPEAVESPSALEGLFTGEEGNLRIPTLSDILGSAVTQIVTSTGTPATEAQARFNDLFSLSSRDIGSAYMPMLSAYMADDVYHMDDIEDSLTALGFSDIQQHHYTDARTSFDDHLVAYTFGCKTLVVNGEPTMLYAVMVRGTHGVDEWISDFIVGGAGDHLGFRSATDEMMNSLRGYVAMHPAGSMNTKFWIVGHSRGAAVANLTAADIIRGNGSIQADEDDVYAYCFACPVMQPKDEVMTTSAIRNYNNLADLVPNVPLESWGFARNGVTYDLNSSYESSQMLHNLCLGSLRFLMPTRAAYVNAWNAAVRKGTPQNAVKEDDETPVLPLLACSIREICNTADSQYTKLTLPEHMMIGESVIEFFSIWLIHGGLDAHTMATTYLELMEAHSLFGQQASQIRSDLRSR